MMRGMPSLREYAGPADAVEIMVSDSQYALVVRKDLTVEQAESLGYCFDSDEAVRSGRLFARRKITVSDELGLRLDSSMFEAGDGSHVVQWPVAKGTPADQTVDDETLPATRLVEIEPDVFVSSSEAERMARDFAEAETAIADLPPLLAGNLTASSDVVVPALRDERAQRIDVLEGLIAASNEAHERAKAAVKSAERGSVEQEEARQAVEAIAGDRKNLVTERDALAKLNEEK